MGLVFFLGFVFVVIQFMNDNSDAVQLQFMAWRTKSLSLGMMAFLLFITGFAVAFILALGAVISQSIEAARLRRENQALQKLLEERHSVSSKI